MTDTQPHEDLTGYLDDALTPEERAAVERALAQDPALREELALLRATSEHLRTHGPVDAPVGFHERLMAQLALEPAPARPAVPEAGWRRWLGVFTGRAGLPVQGLALVGVAAALVLAVMSAQPSPSSVAPEPAPVASAPPVAADPLPVPAQPVGGPVELAQAPGGGPAPTPTTALPRMSDEGQKLIDELVGSSAADPDGLALVDEPAPAGAGGEGVAGELRTDEPTRAVLTAALAYRLRVSEPGALRQLDELARSQQGRLVDAEGAPLTPDTLEPGQRQLVHLRVPASRVTAVVLGLRRLGTAQHQGGQLDRLYGEDLVDIAVEVERP